MKYDLHIHSNISDGKLNRNQIISLAEEKQLKYIAFTEHNKFQEFDMKEVSTNLKIIQGIEFDAKYKKSFHILCYFKEFDNNIENLIKKFQYNTNNRMELLLRKIKEVHNINLTIKELQDFSNQKYITKREIIDWLLFNGFSDSVEDAANKFTSKPSLSYVEKYTLNFRDIADSVKSSNGKIILAHPTTLNYNEKEFELFLRDLIENGLDGIETTNTSKINNKQSVYLRRIAQKYNLLTSGGSDFHNFNDYKLGVDNNDANSLIKVLKK